MTPAGGVLWRLSYRFGDPPKQKTLALGAYPTLGLIDARNRRETAKDDLRAGRDPGAPRAVAAAQFGGLTLAEATRKWHALKEHNWTPAYARQVWARIEADILPDYEGRTLGSITQDEMLATLQKVEKRGVLETSRRLKQYVSAIYRLAAVRDKSLVDPAAMLEDELKKPPKPRHHKRLKHGEIGPFLMRLDNYDGEPETRLALTLAMLTAVRTSELRGARWDEFDRGKRALWEIPGERMKMGDPHIVPLSKQTLAALKDLPELTGKSGYLLPGMRGGSVSQNTLLFAMYRMGYHGRATVHGFRGNFSTEANEAGFVGDHIEMQLAHDERDKTRSSYNAAQYLPQRREIMQWWADHLDKLKRDAESKAEIKALVG